MPHLALSFDLGERDAEAVEELCFECGALSVTLSDCRDDAVLEPAPGEIRLWPATRVQALFAAADASPALVQRLAVALALDAGEFEVKGIADRAWEREWLRDFHAMRFGRRLWICPQHEQVEADDAVVVKLDPGLAFGTGTHASTAMCLTWLDQNLQRDVRAIDYGCGSGILGIAAARLGASRVQSFDIDPQALTACRDNAASNGVADVVQKVQHSGALLGDSDVLLANILAGTLIELAPTLAALVRDGGSIVLAGILADQVAAVTAAYAPWFDIALAGRRDDWVALAGERHPSKHVYRLP
jgi:ribosomal protein L11 methyltransferase